MFPQFIPAPSIQEDPLPSPPIVKKTILVTHADSYLGHTIAHTLALDKSIHVRITARRGDAVRDLINLGCQFKLLHNTPDAMDPHFLDDIYAGIATVVLIPQLVHPEFEQLVEHHVHAFNRSVNTMKSMVLVSSIRGSKRFPTPWLGLDKCENLVLNNQGSHSTVLRIGYIQQNLVALSQLISERAILPLPIGLDMKMNLVNLKDVAVAVRSICPGGQRFNSSNKDATMYTLTGSVNVTGKELARLASSVLGFEIRFVNINDSVMREILYALPGYTETEIEAYLAMYQDIRDGGVHDQITKTLAHLLPRAPISLDEFFADNMNQFRPN